MPSGQVVNTTLIVGPVTRKRLASRENLTIVPPHSKRRKIDVPVPIHSCSEQALVRGRSKVPSGLEVVATELLNPLPTSRPHTRPACCLFFWGAGDDGQHGMGEAHLNEIGKPRCNSWVRGRIEKGVFGDAGAGLEAIAAGGLHTLFLDEKGTVWSCGSHDAAALGRTISNSENEAAADERTSTPHPVQSLIDEHFRTVKIVTGDNICAALSNSGALRVWGSLRNLEGRETFYHVPKSILQLAGGENMSDVVCGINHVLMLTTHGNVYSWGLGEHGQLGVAVPNGEEATGSEKVTFPTQFSRAVVIGTGNCHSFAVDNRGDVWGWGLNAHGQTGTGLSDSKTDSVVPLPKKLVGLSREELGGKTVVQIAGGEFHSVFLIEDGRVFACGRTVGGELGLGKDHRAFKDRLLQDCLPTPTQVPIPDPDDRVIHIDAGARRSMAITERGLLYCWGEGHQSELGLGTGIEQVDEPTVVATGAIAVSCGGQHTLALFK